MKQYTTKRELRRFASELVTAKRSQLRKSAESRSPRGATFLSHSSQDDDLVDGAIRILTEHGAHVYIDTVDPEMPPYTNEDTASTLKSRIRQSKKFVLLATKNSKESKWVPWELGVADGYKGLDGIALFPAVEEPRDTAWTSWEFMGLYQRIIWGKFKGDEEAMWVVLDEEKNNGTPLRKWLKN